jgi:hypothetical protein
VQRPIPVSAEHCNPTTSRLSDKEFSYGVAVLQGYRGVRLRSHMVPDIWRIVEVGYEFIAGAHVVRSCEGINLV